MGGVNDASKEVLSCLNEANVVFGTGLDLKVASEYFGKINESMRPLMNVFSDVFCFSSLMIGGFVTYALGDVAVDAYLREASSRWKRG
jgi:hypothetical protein